MLYKCKTIYDIRTSFFSILYGTICFFWPFPVIIKVSCCRINNLKLNQDRRVKTTFYAPRFLNDMLFQYALSDIGVLLEI